MEDDDEFGDLYTDVLQSFQSSSQPSSSAPAPPQSLHRLIDLSLKTEDEILAPAPPPRSRSKVLEAKDVKLQSKDSDLTEKEVNFDIEEEGNNGISGLGLDAMIPGLSATAPVNNTVENNPEGSRRDGGRGDDWGSDDSEDDLQRKTMKRDVGLGVFHHVGVGVLVREAQLGR